jgi:spermidine synthase
VLADGRNFLLTTPARYDVIISEPSNPWIGGLAALFSVEFFELARRRLKPGGIMAQWVHGYNLLPEDLQMVVRTFRAVFPVTTVWQSTPGDYVVIGRAEPGPLDLGRLRARYESSPGVREDLARIGMQSWAGILGHFMVDEAGTGRLSGEGQINTDDRLPLEFRAPRGLFIGTIDRNLQLVRSARNTDIPDVTAGSRRQVDQAEARYQIGLAYARRDLWDEALAQYQKALELGPTYRPALLAAGQAYRQLDRPKEALAMAQKVLQREPGNAEAMAQAGLAHSALSEHGQAMTLLERAVALQPQNAGYRGLLEEARARAGPPQARPDATPGTVKSLR